MNQFHVGQKVVCIDDDKVPPAGHIVLTDFVIPEKGKIYTIRRTLLGKVGNVPCVLLDEIPDQVVEVLAHGVLRTGDVIFNAVCFRPLVTRKTDISCFTDMLKPKTVEVAA